MSMEMSTTDPLLTTDPKLTIDQYKEKWFYPAIYHKYAGTIWYTQKQNIRNMTQNSKILWFACKFTKIYIFVTPMVAPCSQQASRMY